MIVLDTTSRKLQVQQASGSASLTAVVYWRDVQTTTYTPGGTYTSIGSNSITDIVAAPAASTQRLIEHIQVKNDSASAVTVTMIYYDSASYEIFSCDLDAGGAVTYSDGDGWQVRDAVAATRVTVTSALQVLAKNEFNQHGTTIPRYDAFAFPVRAGKTYWFRFVAQAYTPSSAIGSRWSIRGPRFTAVRFKSQYGVSTTAETLVNCDEYDLPTGPNLTSPTSAQNLVLIEGFVEVLADGAVDLVHASEVLTNDIGTRWATVEWMCTS